MHQGLGRGGGIGGGASGGSSSINNRTVAVELTEGPRDLGDVGGAEGIDRAVPRQQLYARADGATQLRARRAHIGQALWSEVPLVPDCLRDKCSDAALAAKAKALYKALKKQFKPKSGRTTPTQVDGGDKTTEGSR